MLNRERHGTDVVTTFARGVRMTIGTEGKHEAVTAIRPSRRRHLYLSSLVLRIIIALLVSWVLAMLFFGAAAISH